MHNLLKRIVVLCAMILIANSAIAYESYSHSVLTLPDNPRIEQPWNQIITTQEDWESFFNQTLIYMQFEQGQAPSAPEIDFENYQVVSGGIGVRPSSGYYLSVNQVQELEDKLWMHIFMVEPGPGCATLSMLTYPSTTVLIKKTEKPIEFTISLLTESCGN